MQTLTLTHKQQATSDKRQALTTATSRATQLGNFAHLGHRLHTPTQKRQRHLRHGDRSIDRHACVERSKVQVNQSSHLPVGLDAFRVVTDLPQSQGVVQRAGQHILAVRGEG